MSDAAPSAIEAQICALCEAGDYAGAATLAIEHYGPEILGFLIATLRSEDAAGEVFSQVAEDLWKGIEAFAWRSSFRTWIYTVARNAAARYWRSPHNRPSRRGEFSRAAKVAQAVRTRTVNFMRTEVKDRFADIRESLDPDDQALLILRIDRELEWLDLARIMADGEHDDVELTRAAAKLRKRFSRIVNELRERAEAAGLLTDE